MVFLILICNYSNCSLFFGVQGNGPFSIGRVNVGNFFGALDLSRVFGATLLWSTAYPPRVGINYAYTAGQQFSGATGNASSRTHDFFLTFSRFFF